MEPFAIRGGQCKGREQEKGMMVLVLYVNV